MTVKTFNGNLQIHIRQYKQFGKGALYPTKIGFTLTPSRFAAMLIFIDTIKSSVEKLRNREFVNCKLHLGGGIFVKLNSQFPTIVDFRRFFLPQGETTPCPTKWGIALRLHEWDSLVAHLGDINKLIDVKPCFESHPDLSTALRCEECSPFQPFITQNY